MVTKQIPILLNTVDSIKQFGYVVDNYPYYLKIIQEDKTMDAISVIGLFMFNLLQPLYLEYEVDKEADVLNLFEPFILDVDNDILDTYEHLK